MRTTIVRCATCGNRNRVPAAGPGRPRCGACHSFLPWIVDAADDDFREVAESAKPPVLVDMWATWCAPCRMVSPALEELATERAGAVKLVKVDVDRAPKLSERFDIRAVPTLLILDRGETIARQAGAVPISVLRRWFDSAIERTTVAAPDEPADADRASS
ncbi:MAG: trxA [Rhodoglobus sp.]|nr:trxA [Rhodoglobus sp.]